MVVYGLLSPCGSEGCHQSLTQQRRALALTAWRPARRGFGAGLKQWMPVTWFLAPTPRAPRKDPRTRVVAAAVVACSLHGGALTEVGRITQVLPAGCNVVQGEAFALALLLKHTTGDAAVTADCKPAILQAQGAFFKNAHANIWEEVREERHRLIITWHPSHRPASEYQGGANR